MEYETGFWLNNQLFDIKKATGRRLLFSPSFLSETEMHALDGNLTWLTQLGQSRGLAIEETRADCGALCSLTKCSREPDAYSGSPGRGRDKDRVKSLKRPSTPSLQLLQTPVGRPYGFTLFFSLGLLANSSRSFSFHFFCNFLKFAAKTNRVRSSGSVMRSRSE